MSKKLTRELIAQKAKSDRIQNIKNLNLWGSNLDDISIISEMPSLEIVSLSVNKIRTLKPFANCPNLRELYLRNNLIADLKEPTMLFILSVENFFSKSSIQFATAVSSHQVLKTDHLLENADFIDPILDFQSSVSKFPSNFDHQFTTSV